MANLFGWQVDRRLGGTKKDDPRTVPGSVANIRTRTKTKGNVNTETRVPVAPAVNPPPYNPVSTRGSTGDYTSRYTNNDYIAPQITIPTGPTAAERADVSSLRDRRLEAALATIGATFGGNIAQQQALLAELDPAFAQLEAANLRNLNYAGTDALEAAAERGIFRSTIAADNYERATTPYTEATAEAARLKGKQEQEFKSAIAQYEAQQDAEELEARLASEKDALDYELYLAQLGF